MQNVILVFQELFTYCLCSFFEKCTLKNGCKDSYSCDSGVAGLFLHTEG